MPDKALSIIASRFSFSRSLSYATPAIYTGCLPPIIWILLFTRIFIGVLCFSSSNTLFTSWWYSWLPNIKSTPSGICFANVVSLSQTWGNHASLSIKSPVITTRLGFSTRASFKISSRSSKSMLGPTWTSLSWTIL